MRAAAEAFTDSLWVTAAAHVCSYARSQTTGKFQEPEQSWQHEDLHGFHMTALISIHSNLTHTEM